MRDEEEQMTGCGESECETIRYGKKRWGGPTNSKSKRKYADRQETFPKILACTTSLLL